MPVKRPVFLFLVLLLAAGVRLAGIRFGEPLAVHPHEDLLITDAMEAGARKGHPGRFEYPSGMVYFTLAVQGLHYLFSGADSVRDFWMSYNSHPFEFHLWSRVATVFWALAGIWGIWLLGSEWDRGRTSMRFLGGAGAWLLAVHLLHIRESRFATVDVPLATAMTFALWWLLREYHRPATTILRLLPIALFIGICSGIHYPALLLIFPMWYVGLAAALKEKETSLSFSWMIGCAALQLVCAGAGFLLTTPYALIDSGKLWSDIGFGMYSAFSEGGAIETGSSLGYLQGPWLWGGGIALGVFSFFGLMMAVLRHEEEDRVLLSFAVPFFIILGLAAAVWGRWFLPLVPLQILWAVRFIAVYADHPWAVQWMASGARKTVAGIILFLIGLESLVPALRQAHLLRKTDSRVAAMGLLDSSVRPLDVVLTTPFCPPLPKTVQKRTERGLLVDRAAFEKGQPYQPSIASLEDFREEGVNLILYSSFYWDAALDRSLIHRIPSLASYSAFLTDLKLQAGQELEVLSTSGDVPFHAEDRFAPTFHLWSRRCPGPDVFLYRLRK